MTRPAPSLCPCLVSVVGHLSIQQLSSPSGDRRRRQCARTCRLGAASRGSHVAPIPVSSAACVSSSHALPHAISLVASRRRHRPRIHQVSLGGAPFLSPPPHFAVCASACRFARGVQHGGSPLGMHASPIGIKSPHDRLEWGRFPLQAQLQWMLDAPEARGKQALQCRGLDAHGAGARVGLCGGVWWLPTLVSAQEGSLLPGMWRAGLAHLLVSIPVWFCAVLS